jgi:hypothetical protein
MVRPRGHALALALVVLTVVGCAADESPTPATGSTSSGDEGSSAAPDTGGSDNPPAEPSLRPGQVALGFVGGNDAPRVVVNMEPGYETFDGFALLGGRGNQFRGLGLWNAAPARGERVAKYNRLIEIASDQPELPYGLA